MYSIECKKKFNMDLNIEDYNLRLKKLLNNNNKKKVVYIKGIFDNSTFRYRYYNVNKTMQNSLKYETVCFNASEIYKILPYISQMDIIVLQRASWLIEIENLIYYAKINKKPLVYDMDDLIYKAEYAIEYIDNIGYDYSDKNIDFFLALAARHDLCAKKADFFITTTEYLANFLNFDYKKDTFIINNYLNYEQINESNYILKHRIKSHKNKFMIGYFSGSPSHNKDFKIVSMELANLMEKYSNIYLKIVGFIDLPESLKKFEKNGRIIFKEIIPYQQLQYEIAEADLNIIPLQNNEFNNCKSELKFFESAIVKVPTCVSPTSVYKSLPSDCCLLCNEGEWYSNIEKLYLDNELYYKMVNSAFEYVKNHYYPEKKLKDVEKIFDKIIELNIYKK